MIRCLILLMLFMSLSVGAQNTAVGYNEKLVYTASYNMSGILNDIAEISMETSPVKTSKATFLRLKCNAATYSQWDSFFKIRDLYESYVSPKTLKPYVYKRNINEGGYYKEMKYTFSHNTNTIKSVQTKKNNRIEKRDFKFNTGTKDIVSTIYSIRLLDFESMEVGQRKVTTIVFDRKETKATITYLGKEQINTAIGKKECYKIAIGSESKIIEGSRDNLLWLTADANKIMVYGKFKIPVGNGELKIKSASGLKN
ncbi:DUF3108 domain-containing protein [Seonamhaeicola sp. ML3]|uniref:DUF3108 domain-containing protein n=1 Tax=Seonamhaeicola sp. ML3 TaxID=2937786 RepID=UPI00200D071B|nr:DUF3108 domain-containing protein [Seonamhaeicola sp. ML3]